MSLPLATVAMVAYNSSTYIADAIRSVLAQSYEHLELVVCDDHSTDETWKIVQNFSDERIRAYRNERNLGEYANRNKALSLAQGDYLIYIDGDDLLYPHGLEFMVRMLSAFPAAAMALARPWSEQFVYPVQLSPRQFYRFDFLGPGIIGINFAHILFRTEKLKEVGGLSTQYRTGDTYIQYVLARSFPALLISDGLAWWRRTPGQASEELLQTNSYWPETVRYRQEVLSHPNCPLDSDEKQQALANLYGLFTRLLLYTVLQGQPRKAYHFLRASKIPRLAWRYILTRSTFNYNSHITAVNPLQSELAQNPYAILRAKGVESEKIST